ncbi:MAG: T9SS type A sorting domain-containing protein [Bacteroidales bacterium]|jgi:hypothetical protein
MKKSIIVFLFNLTVILSSKGQLNPIQNLYWHHTYEYPNNCYVLSWEKPDSSLTDTLIGYNIYRDDSLYTFTTDLNHSCDPCDGIPGQPFCDFIKVGGFYMHVTAVYNNESHDESIYNDSAECYGKANGIKNTSTINALAILNIIQDNSAIRIDLNQPIAKGALIMTNVIGQTIFIISIDNQKSIEIDKSNFNSGLYFLNIKTNKVNLNRKILIK